MNIFLCFPGSIYSALAVAIGTYVSFCHPHFTHCKGNLSVPALLIFSILFSCLRFVEFRTVYDYRVSEELLFHIKRYQAYHFVISMITPTLIDSTYVGLADHEKIKRNKGFRLFEQLWESPKQFAFTC